MRTLVIRISAPKKKGGPFPIELLDAASDDPQAFKPVLVAKSVRVLVCPYAL